MCRWLAYSGSPILLEELLHKPKHSLIDQSLHSRLGATTTNGDGFGARLVRRRRHARPLPQRRAGLERPQPAGARGAHRARRSSSPTSARRPAPRCSRRTAIPSGTAAGSGCTTARSATSSASSAISRSPSTRRSTRRSKARPTRSCSSTWRSRSASRTTRRRRCRTPSASSRRPAAQHDVEHPIQMTVATTDGESIWAFRYSTRAARARSSSAPSSRRCGCCTRTTSASQGLDDETRLVVSEPLGNLMGAWNEVPESSYGIVQPGEDGCTTSGRQSRPSRWRRHEGSPPARRRGAVAAARLAAGCGGDDGGGDATAAAEWADDVCSASATWTESVTEAARSLQEGGLGEDGLQSAVEDVESATQRVRGRAEVAGAARHGGRRRRPSRRSTSWPATSRRTSPR